MLMRAVELQLGLWRNRERTRLRDQVLLNGDILAGLLSVARLFDSTKGRFSC